MYQPVNDSFSGQIAPLFVDRCQVISLLNPLGVAGLALSFLTAFSVHARGHFDRIPPTVPLPTSFAQCKQFFVNGRPPLVQRRPALRELCYESFAVLHSGETKTLLYVADRLNRETLEDAHEKRADRFFADARLPLQADCGRWLGVHECVLPDRSRHTGRDLQCDSFATRQSDGCPIGIGPCRLAGTDRRPASVQLQTLGHSRNHDLGAPDFDSGTERGLRPS